MSKIRLDPVAAGANSARLERGPHNLRFLFPIILLVLVAPACSSPGPEPEPAQGTTPDLSDRIAAGLQEYKRADFESAADRFGVIAKLDPENERIFFYLGSAFLQLHQHRAALEAFDRAVFLKEGFREARLARARVQIRMGDFPAAEIDLRRVLEQDPESLTALFNLGFLLVRMGKYEEAVRRLERVLSLRPDHPEAPYYLGKAALAMGEVVKAKQAFETAIRLDPDNARSYFNLGNLLIREGQRKEGEERLAVFKRLSDQVTQSEHIREQIHILGLEAFLLQKEGKTDEAVAKYREVLRIAPDHVPTRKDLAIVFLSQGETDEALGELIRATQIDPNYAPPYFHLARIYEERGETGKARAATERFRRLDSGGEAREEGSRSW